MNNLLFKHKKWLPKGPLYILFDTHEKNLDHLSGKYNFHSLHNNIPSYENKIPICLNENGAPESDQESNHFAPVNLIYVRFNPDVVGWCFLTEGLSFLEGKSVSHFELPTTGNLFDISILLIYIIYCNMNYDYENNFLETDPLKLDSRWIEVNADKRIATIKIFSDQETFEEYQKCSQKL